MNFKKLYILVFVLMLSTSLLFSGCSSSGEDLEKKIDQIEQNIKNKESGKTNPEDENKDFGYDTYKAKLTTDMKKEAKELDISNDKIVEIMTELTIGDAREMGLTIDEYMDYLDSLGMTPLGAAKSAAKMVNMNLVQIYDLLKMAESMEEATKGFESDEEEEDDPEEQKYLFYESIQYALTYGYLDTIEEWNTDSELGYKYYSQTPYNEIFEWVEEDISDSDDYDKSTNGKLTTYKATFRDVKIEMVIEKTDDNNKSIITLIVKK